MHQSFATIDSPEFINLQPLDINPLMSSCEIKVLYIGENRNRSYITKEVATEMSKTLRGAPIVGYYRQDKEDFADHGEKVTIDDQGIKFECMTVPYGFVSPDAKVWFQKFEAVDDLGNTVVREYLMTTGFLWTGQFPECKGAVEGDGKPHSMELDGNSLKGEWSKNINEDMEFFIINDAVFSKLCILGEDVEPCFEGSSITAPKVSSTFNLDDNFKQTLFNMMQDLKFALEGGQEKMVLENTEKTLDKTNESVVTEFENVSEGQSENSDVTAQTEFEKKEDEKKEKAPADNKESEVPAEKKKEDEEYKKCEKKDYEKKEEEKEAPAQTSADEKKDEEKKEEKKFSLEEYSALEEKITSLQKEYAELETKYQALVAFKNEVEEEKKDALINSFYMLSDEDKKDVVENKAQYSLEDIEAKLSVICVRKKVNFELEDNTTDVATTFSLSEQQDSLPAWINAVKNTQNGRY